MPTPYALSSDLVSAWPAKSLEVATYLDTALAAKTDLAMVKNAQTGTSYSYALADQTKLLTMSNASANTVTVTKQATVMWAADTQLRVLNIGAGATTLVADTGVTINNNTALAQWRGGVLIRMSSDVWTFVPFASGVGAAVYSDANTGTYTGYAYKTFTASGTLTVTTAGFADILVIGGGASSGRVYRSGGGGAGGHLVVNNAYLPVGTLTVTVGAGGAAAVTGESPGFNGNTSRLDSYFAAGGGGGACYSPWIGNNGGSGGGGAGFDGSGAGGSGTTGLGNNGGAGVIGAGGGGGGSSAVGAAGSGTAGGAGGDGTANSFTNTSVTRAGGGGGYGSGSAGVGGSGGGGAGGATGTAGLANTGGGGGALAAAGGSGLVIVRVAV